MRETTKIKIRNAKIENINPGKPGFFSAARTGISSNHYLSFLTMRKLVFIFISIMVAGQAISQPIDKLFIKTNFERAGKQLKNMLAQIEAGNLRYPRSTDSSGKLTTTDMYGWTSGFFPG